MSDTATLTQATRVGEARSPWVRSLAWDAFWLQSALWLAPLALLLAHGYEDPSESPLDLLVFGLTALFWTSHRFGSSWLAYATTAYRPLLRAEPVRFVIVPIAIAAACFAILLPEDDALAFTRAERVMALAMVDFGLVTYHFAAQHFGVLSLYRVHSGRTADHWMRRLDRLFALGVGGALVVVAEALAGTTLFQSVWLGAGLDPEWLSGASGMLRVVATALVLALTLAMLGSEARAPSVSLPRVLYVLGVAVMVCGGLHTDRPFLFVAVWAGQHWLAATALATRVAWAEPAPTGSFPWRMLHAVNRRPWALLLVLALLSVVLLPVMEVEAIGPDDTYYGDRIFGALAVALRTSEWVPALVALGFTTGFLHYWLDRAVYRLSRPAVRIAARGLL
ncbi:MAG TPA: hypothetical protein VGK37_03795 [Casimicrobiaceae bacterium]